ncbi:hypothetical protein HYPSUDRAFT_201296 [Hypholoma sublateritium FD-334 SS-4]|uniref:Uncharacterized protein n=1 Tax=Hypholoma sublateritium (strain FD-334 SS-4) TaxID=945553 RepID=A0A0D2P4F1_HYPSF|nr:hypothetical protein HYPSUDRAFT_201296 [Hypholoma sublateritium FD-334 SS-4]
MQPLDILGETTPPIQAISADVDFVAMLPHPRRHALRVLGLPSEVDLPAMAHQTREILHSTPRALQLESSHARARNNAVSAARKSSAMDTEHLASSPRSTSAMSALSRQTPRLPGYPLHTKLTTALNKPSPAKIDQTLSVHELQALGFQYTVVDPKKK